MRNELRSEKITESIQEFETEFHKWDVMRNVFKTIHLPNFKISNLDEDFVKIGYSHIIPRNFFTDPTGKVYYDNKGIGSHYGKGLAFGEIKYILNVLENKIDEEDEKIREKSDVTSCISAMFNTYPDVDFGVLANPTIISDFINLENFKLTYEGTIWGYYANRPLYWTPEVPKNIVYIIDRNLGKLFIKEDIKMEVQEIHLSEYEKVLNDVKSLSITDLPNMIRVKANELIYFKERDKHRNGVIRITVTESE